MLKRFISHNGKIFIFWFTIGAIVFLGSFLIGNLSLAADDNVVLPLCGTDY